MLEDGGPEARRPEAGGRDVPEAVMCRRPEAVMCRRPEAGGREVPEAGGPEAARGLSIAGGRRPEAWRPRLEAGGPEVEARRFFR